MASSPRLPRLSLTLLALLALAAIVLERLGYAGAWRGAFDPAEAGRQLGYAVPSLLYCAALWQLREAAAKRSWAVLARRLQRAGVLLAAGALSALLLVPALRRAWQDDAARVIDLDVASLVLAGLGIGLALLARQFLDAAKVEADLEAMF